MLHCPIPSVSEGCYTPANEGACAAFLRQRLRLSIFGAVCSKLSTVVHVPVAVGQQARERNTGLRARSPASRLLHQESGAGWRLNEELRPLRHAPDHDAG